MKSSMFLAAASAAMVVAGPIGLRKLAMATHLEVEIVTVTVTAASMPSGGISSWNSAPEPQPEPKPNPIVKNPKSRPVIEMPRPSQSSSRNGGDYETTCLKHHNLHRMNHSAPALQWDDQLAHRAKQLADTCVFEHDTSMGTMGQNLAAWGSTSDIHGAAIKSAARVITNHWYNGEVGSFTGAYGLADPPSSLSLGAYGHFTQVVWKETKKVGCATAKCHAGTILSMQSWFTVCNYSPSGNVGGQYGVNVLRTLGKATVTA